MLEVSAFAGLDGAEANGVVETAVLGRHKPYAALPDERFSTLPIEALAAQDTRVEVGGGLVPRIGDNWLGHEAHPFVVRGVERLGPLRLPLLYLAPGIIPN